MISNTNPFWQQACNRMVKEQIQARGIQNPNILTAFQKVPRHNFVSEEYQEESYNDYPLPILSNQTISQPYIVAFMVEKIFDKKYKTVLEIGSGSGYQTAILAEIFEKVYSIERIRELYLQCQKNLSYFQYNNIVLKFHDGYLGWEKDMQFDAIIVSCRSNSIPDALVEQLKEDGKMIIPVGNTMAQDLKLVKKTNKKLIVKNVLPVSFIPMLHGVKE